MGWVQNKEAEELRWFSATLELFYWKSNLIHRYWISPPENTRTALAVLFFTKLKVILAQEVEKNRYETRLNYLV